MLVLILQFILSLLTTSNGALDSQAPHLKSEMSMTCGDLHIGMTSDNQMFIQMAGFPAETLHLGNSYRVEFTKHIAFYSRKNGETNFFLEFDFTGQNFTGLREGIITGDESQDGYTNINPYDPNLCKLNRFPEFLDKVREMGEGNLKVPSMLAWDFTEYTELILREGDRIGVFFEDVTEGTTEVVGNCDVKSLYLKQDPVAPGVWEPHLQVENCDTDLADGREFLFDPKINRNDVPENTEVSKSYNHFTILKAN